MLLVLPMVAAAAVIWKASAAEPEQQCPEVDKGDHTVLLPNPADCSTFFSCSNGVAILMKCPDGLYFYAKLDVCDWPRNVDSEDCNKGGNKNILKGYFLSLTSASTSTVVIPAGGSVSIFGITITGNKGEAYSVTTETWACVEAKGNPDSTCDTSEQKTNVTHSKIG